MVRFPNTEYIIISNIKHALLTRFKSFASFIELFEALQPFLLEPFFIRFVCCQHFAFIVCVYVMEWIKFYSFSVCFAFFFRLIFARWLLLVDDLAPLHLFLWNCPHVPRFQHGSCIQFGVLFHAYTVSMDTKLAHVPLEITHMLECKMQSAMWIIYQRRWFRSDYLHVMRQKLIKKRLVAFEGEKERIFLFDGNYASFINRKGQASNFIAVAKWRFSSLTPSNGQPQRKYASNVPFVLSSLQLQSIFSKVKMTFDFIQFVFRGTPNESHSVYFLRFHGSHTHFHFVSFSFSCERLRDTR